MHLDLNGTWELLDTDLAERGPEVAERLLRQEDGWIPATVPGDVHVDLVAAGRIAEPTVGLNAPLCEWVEERSWWYRTAFELPEEQSQAEHLALGFEGLDTTADVYLNGERVGGADNAFIEHVFDVTGRARAGRNVLLVRVDCGLYAQRDRPLNVHQPQHEPERQRIRVWIRKPQFCFKWDWAPRIVTCGLWRPVWLRAENHAAIRDVWVRSRIEGETAIATVQVEAFVFDPLAGREAVVEVRLKNGGRPFRRQRRAHLQSGRNDLAFEIPIPNAALWWPRGAGPQELTEASVRLTHKGQLLDEKRVRTGLREVGLDQDEWSHGERLWAVTVNGRKIFCRGGNWIPADSLPARVGREKYRALIQEAAEANFNMLRIWGGGIYESEDFYAACDEAGLLIWQDFMFACATYPDEDPHFCAEVRREARQAVKRLRNHPCLALWCGNNENHWGLVSWGWPKPSPQLPLGTRIYNELLPEVCRELDPDRPYWPSSPYGGADPNGYQLGDSHTWHITMAPAIPDRIKHESYDEVRAKFISEFGYIGPPVRASVETYLGERDPTRGSEAWNFHTNEFEKGTVVAGIARHYRDPEELTLDEYLLYAGLVQGFILRYALEAARWRRGECWGSLFWMYNDCWGEVGWTIIDAYLRRKPSFYAVRRAFADRALIVREPAGQMVLRALNETPKPFAGTLEWGLVPLDRPPEPHRQPIRIPPHQAHTVALGPSPEGKDRQQKVLFARLLRGREEVARTIFLFDDFRRLHVPDPIAKVQIEPAGKDTVQVRLAAETFVHAVTLEARDRAIPEDNYFDLLPGETRAVKVTGTRPEEVRVRGVGPGGIVALERI